MAGQSALANSELDYESIKQNYVYRSRTAYPSRDLNIHRRAVIQS